MPVMGLAPSTSCKSLGIDYDFLDISSVENGDENMKVREWSRLHRQWVRSVCGITENW